MTNLDTWEIKYIENEIIKYLDNAKKVYILDGCLNDSIIFYSINIGSKEREVIFTTSAYVFPQYINLMESSLSIYTEDWKGNLFVHMY